MVDFTNAEIKKLIVHRVGNKLTDDGVVLSGSLIQTAKDERLTGLLLRYFLTPFKEPIYYNFHHVSSLDLNEIYSIAYELFESTSSFVKKSKDIANILYEYSNHPKIKAGELYVAYFEDCRINQDTTDAIGIFKSENKDSFLKVLEDEKSFQLDADEGIDITKLDKGCLIFNTDADEGFKVMMIDNLNKGNEAQYWKDEFLKLKPVSDNYHQTKNYLSLAKSFVTERLDDEFEVTKADQIDYLNRSIDYFKKNEEFNERDFAKEVFEFQEVIQSFKRFKNDFEDEHDVNLVSEFSISNHAVKKQSGVFKTVLKLDRNFHIYIHGDKNLIERGVDDDGRKYYKIYYNEES